MRNRKDFFKVTKLLAKFVSKDVKIMKEYCATLLTGLLIFLTPIQGLVISVGMAIILDTFTGIYKSVKLRGWQSIKSHKLSTIISKMVLYQISLLCLFPIDKFVLNDLLLQMFSIEFLATKLACVLLLIVELTSIKENVEEALSINIWKALRDFLRRAKDVANDINDIQTPRD